MRCVSTTGWRPASGNCRRTTSPLRARSSPGSTRCRLGGLDVQRAGVGDKPIFIGRSYHFELTLDLAGLAPEDVGAELVVARPVEPDRVVEVIRTVPLSQVQVSGSQVTFALDYVPEQAGMFDMALRIFPQNPMLPHRMDFALVKWA